MNSSIKNSQIPQSIIVETAPQLPVKQPYSGWGMDDIYYLLFRHKGKLTLGFLAAVVASGLIVSLWPKVFESQAKLLILYVTESRTPTEVVGNDAQSRSPDQRGETIINTEVEILTSLDLAMRVAELVGPEKIVNKESVGSSLNAAAGTIQRQLSVKTPKNSKVIHATFQHSDPETTQQTLQLLIDTYLEKHVEVHRSVGIFDDLLTKERDQLRQRLIQTDEALRQLKAQAGVTSLDAAKDGFLSQILKIRDSIFETEAELAQHRALVEQLYGRHDQTTTNNVDEIGAEDATLLADIPHETLDSYLELSRKSDLLLKREQELLLQFTDQSPMVIGIRNQLDNVRQQKRAFETQYPGIVQGASIHSVSNDYGYRKDHALDNPQVYQFTQTNQIAQVVALQSKYNVLTNQLALLRMEAAELDKAEGAIKNLERQHEIEDARFRLISQTKEQARIEEALGDGRVSNISLIQSPSFPRQVLGDLIKALGISVACLIGIPLGWAMVSECMVDQSVRTAKDVEKRLEFPLQMVIPRFSRRSQKLRRRSYRKKQKALIKKGKLPAIDSKEPPPWEMLPGMRPYFEAMRDAVVDDFEIRNLTRKPKLVAVAGCESGSGVTAIAGGLAGTLSEIGDGKVLLVNMHKDGAETRYFHGGRLKHSLNELLELENQDDAKVQENLYLADGTRKETKSPESTSDSSLPLPPLTNPHVTPKFFSHMAPRLKASDYDYIIFDMPPFDQLSATPRLARYMDTVLVISESEKTPKQALKRIGEALKQSHTHFQVILNKYRNYIPARIHSAI